MLTMKGWFGVGKKQLGDYVRNIQERVRTLTMHNLLNSLFFLPDLFLPLDSLHGLSLTELSQQVTTKLVA